MRRMFAWLAMGVMCLVQSASAKEMFGFKITHPKEGWIGSADGDLRFFSGAIRPGRPEYLVWSASAKSDATQIWREPVRGDLTKKFLTIDPSAADFQLRLQTEPVASWKWSSVGRMGESNIAHLEVGEGKFKGQFLGIEDDSLEFTPKEGRKSQTTHKLKLVEKQERAMKFTVYVVAP